MAPLYTRTMNQIYISQYRPLSNIVLSSDNYMPQVMTKVFFMDLMLVDFS